MEEDNKLPLKRVELSLTKFNEVVIPHHLDLLRQHKANIIKYGEGGEGGARRVVVEQAAAARAAGRLRAALAELQQLRARVREDHQPAFDRSTQRARDLTLRAIVDYLECQEESAPVEVPVQRREEEAVAGSVVSTDSVGVVAHAGLDQLQVDHAEEELRAREAALRAWGSLQEELRALHETWQLLHEAALLQREQVEAAADSTAVAAGHVEAARVELSLAERLRAGAGAGAGAALGALVGGPLGLLGGLKAGAAAALAGSLLGAAAARLARARRHPPDKDH